MKVREKASIKHSRLGSRPQSVRIAVKMRPGGKLAVARKGLGACSDQRKTRVRRKRLC